MKNKNFTLIAIFLSFILVSCSGEETKQTIKDSAVGGVYAEYLFCDFGPDMSEESFQGLLKDWNNILDDLGPNSVPRSVGLTPRVETDLFDGLWVLVWPSKEASLVGWQEWVDGPAADWTEKTSSIISCGASSNGIVQNYGFDVSKVKGFGDKRHKLIGKRSMNISHRDLTIRKKKKITKNKFYFLVK